MILAAVFLLSFSALAFEVLLTRVFSIAQWNHLSFMVISIALFGFAVSGAFLNILETRGKSWTKRLYKDGSIVTILILFCAGNMIAVIGLNRIPLDYFRLPVDPAQALYLFMTYVVLATPFFFAGLILSLAYAGLPQKTGLIYFASMTGSACGAILPLILIPFLGEEKLLVLAALVPLTLVPFEKCVAAKARNAFSGNAGGNRRYFHLYAGLVVLSAGIYLLAFADSLIAVKPSPYKALSQLLQYPGSRIQTTTHGLMGRIDTVKSPFVRFAPGLSLKYTRDLPEQWAAFKDGDEPLVLYELKSSKGQRFTDFTLLRAGYLTVSKPKSILLIMQGAGGLGIPAALSCGADAITVVQRHPEIAAIIQDQYPVRVVCADPRTFLARSEARFDIIQIENWGTSVPGSGALSQEYLFTIDAFGKYLKHLRSDGVLIVSRNLLLPPADSIRLWATAYEALKSARIQSPERHIVMLRNWNTFTMLLSRQALIDHQKIIEFANERNFDLVYLYGLTAGQANRFNVFEVPYHFLEIDRLARAYRSGTQEQYFKNYALDVVPQTDRRPFPGRLLKWSRLKTLYKTMGSRFYTLFMSGEIIVAVVFIEALMVAFLLLVLPLLAVPSKERKLSAARSVYFLAVGAGFMFAELFFIKEYVALFGDPIISFTAVLAGVLIFSAVGGYYSQRLSLREVKYSLVLLVALLIATRYGLDYLIWRAAGLPTVLRFLAALVLLAPTGIMMGLPFPLGMRFLLNTPGQRAYAWTANGCTSVLASIAAAQLALSFGIPAVITCAVAAYLVALLSIGFQAYPGP